MSSATPTGIDRLRRVGQKPTESETANALAREQVEDPVGLVACDDRCHFG